MLKIKYLPASVEDLDAIFKYIAADRPDAAYNLMDKLQTSISLLAQHPYRGVVPADTVISRMHFRVLIIDAYLIFYKVKPTHVEIHRVLHGKQKYAHILSK